MLVVDPVNQLAELADLHRRGLLFERGVPGAKKQGPRALITTPYPR